MIDTKFPLEDGTFRVSEWTGLTDLFAIARRQDNTILYGLGDGNIGKYTKFRDDGTTFNLTYSSVWLDFGDELHNRLKIIKQIYAIIYGRETLTATARWAFDFRPLAFSETFTNDYEDSTTTEFGIGEFGEDEFATGLRLRKAYVSGAGDGQYFKLFITIASTDVDEIVALQELGVFAKIGRFV